MKKDSVIKLKKGNGKCIICGKETKTRLVMETDNASSADVVSVYICVSCLCSLRKKNEENKK